MPQLALTGGFDERIDFDDSDIDALLQRDRYRDSLRPFPSFTECRRRAGTLGPWLSLHGYRNRFELSALEYLYLLRLALANGWEPTGTVGLSWVDSSGKVVEPSGDVGGRYDCVAGQTVIDPDAWEIGVAVSRGLAQFASLGGFAILAASG